MPGAYHGKGVVAKEGSAEVNNIGEVAGCEIDDAHLVIHTPVLMPNLENILGWQ